MQVQWAEFFGKILKNHSVLTDLDGQNGQVTGLTVRPTGQLQIHCSIATPLLPALRSEERRVGKECIYTWWPYN